MTESIASQGALAEADAWGALAPPRPAAANNDPLAGYALWLNPSYRAGSAYQDAARTTPANVGDPVGGLYDATDAITATATGAARPTRSATGLTFAGAQLMDAAIGARTEPETVYLVAQWTGGAGAVGFALDGITTFSSHLIYANGSAPHISMYNGTRLSNTSSPTGALVALCALFQGASSVLRVGSAEVAGNSGTDSASGLRLGAQGVAPTGTYLIGEIREVLVYRAAHNASTRAAEIAKAAARCGVAL
jgi:hypothetical protein